MTEELIGKIFEMISSAGTARSKYVQAVERAKEDKFNEAEELMKEGGECFLAAHNIHAEMLADESAKIEASGKDSAVSLILVHAEDQMMCAETFRLMSRELIDVYHKMNGNQKQD
ncbi:MAG TPA: PTS lactose/cellobiose transporter subunit IIA [Candidatus Mediterraneibacter norfolkensis]|nr:PTS lactose/cellobiose transporter subunit IIA [Candidatus Mediterraneibacter norfolkensis]